MASNLTYARENVPLGTAGSVKNAEAALKEGTFLIVSGDALTDLDVGKALAFHREKGAVATLVLARVPNPLEFGVVVTDDEGRIQRFLEKPTWSEVFSDTVNTGMYILEPEILDMMEEGKAYDWSSDIFPRLLAEGRPMVGYVMEDYWADVGSLSEYREAQEDLLSGKVDLPIPGEMRDDGVIVGPNCSIDPTATLVPPVCLGRNVRIKANARLGPYAVVGDNVTVEEGANLDRAVVWDGAYIGYHVQVHWRHRLLPGDAQARRGRRRGRRDRRPQPARRGREGLAEGQDLPRQDRRARRAGHDEPRLGREVAGIAFPRAGRRGALEPGDHPRLRLPPRLRLRLVRPVALPHRHQPRLHALVADDQAGADLVAS